MSETMIDLEHAKRALSHRIAGYVHLMLAARHTTVDELRNVLANFPKSQAELLDDLLAAKSLEKISLSLLADIAFALEFEWEMKAVRMDGAVFGPAGQEPPLSPQREAEGKR